MRLFDLIYRQFKENPLDDAFAYKINGGWKKFSSQESIKIINQLSLGLIKLGIEPGDNIAIISEGRPEWAFVDMSCQQVGAVLVPLYPTLSQKDYKAIFEETDIKAVFISDATLYQRILPVVSSLDIKLVFTFNKITDVDSWMEVLRAGKDGDKAELEKRKKAVKVDDLATIIYTSGTSGKPKGVMLSHKNIYANVVENRKTVSLTDGMRVLSFLPLNHIFERCSMYSCIYGNIGVYFAENMDKIGDNFKEVKPHGFTTVPRLLEKVYDRIMKTGSELSGVKKAIFNWAISLGLKYDPNDTGNAVYNRQLKLANKLVFSKWREALGGNIQQIICGASALQPRLARVFWAAGIKVCEGYGMTETSPVISASTVNSMRIGTVGKVHENLEIDFAEDGEILIKGDSVMMGYYKLPELTSEVLTKDGWFKTGDVGKIVDGYLVLTDRKKELFKTSGGMFIAPQQVENRLKESIYVDQAMVVGEGKNFPAVLIVPNFDEIMEETSKNFELIDYENLSSNSNVRKIFQDVITEVNSELGKWEQLKEFRVVGHEWTQETGELTPTLKLKRRVILEKHADLLADIYKEDFSTKLKEFDELDVDVDMEELEKIESI